MTKLFGLMAVMAVVTGCAHTGMAHVDQVALVVTTEQAEQADTDVSQSAEPAPSRQVVTSEQSKAWHDAHPSGEDADDGVNVTTAQR